MPLGRSDAAERFGVYVGDVPANRDLQPILAKEQLGPEGFVLDVSPRGVRILGGGKFGTAYGVYEFLERLGVRWLFPGPWGEVVPQQATIRQAIADVLDQIRQRKADKKMRTDLGFKHLAGEY